MYLAAYYDTHVFRQVYLNGGAEPFNRFLVADNDTAPGQALEAFVRSLFQRALLSSHTIKPDFDDIDAWLDRLFGAVQSLKLPNWGAFIASVFNVGALTLLKTYS